MELIRDNALIERVRLPLRWCEMMIEHNRYSGGSTCGFVERPSQPARVWMHGVRIGNDCARLGY